MYERTLSLSKDRRRVVSRLQGSMATTRRRTGARQNGASLGSDQQAAHPRGVGRLPGDRTLELVRRSGKVCHGSAPSPCVLVQHDVYGTGHGDGEEVAHRPPEERAAKTMAPPDRGRKPLPGEPFGTAGQGRVPAYCALCGKSVVFEWDTRKESCGGHVHPTSCVWSLSEHVRVFCLPVLPNDRHPVRATDCRLEEHRGAEEVVGTDHVETEEKRRAT